MRLNNINQRIQSTTNNRTNSCTNQRRKRYNRNRRTTMTLTRHRPLTTARFNRTRVFRIARSKVNGRLLRMINLNSNTYRNVVTIHNNSTSRNVHIRTQKTTNTTLIKRSRPRIPSNLLSPSIKNQTIRTQTNTTKATLRRGRRKRIIVRIFKHNSRTVRRFSNFPIRYPSKLITNPIRQGVSKVILCNRSKRIMFTRRYRNSEL